MSEGPKSIFIQNVLVYIAGVECPVQGVTINYGIKSIPQASITVPAVEEFIRFGAEDKVPVAIFYADQWYSKTGKQKDIEVSFRLLFDGEITGWGHSRSAYGDAIMLTATHNIITMGQMFANYVQGAGTEQTRNRLDSAGSKDDIHIGYDKIFPYILFKRGFFAAQSTTNINRPFDFVENLLLHFKIGGYPKTTGVFKAVNADGTYTTALLQQFGVANGEDRISSSFYANFLDQEGSLSAAMEFFVRYNHKTKFDQRWIATTLEEFLDSSTLTRTEGVIPVRDPTFKAVMNHITDKTLRNSMENLFGSSDSYLNILNIFYNYVVYEVLMLPPAPYVSVGDRGKIDSGIPETTFDESSPDLRLANYISKPTGNFSIPPESNILFPCLITDTKYDENYSVQATRTVAGSPFLDHFSLKLSTLGQEIIKKYATANGWPIDVMRLTKSPTKLNTQNLLLYPEEYFKGPVLQNITMPAWYKFIIETSGQYENLNKFRKQQKNLNSVQGQPEDDYTTDDETERPTDEQARDANLQEKNTFDIYTRYTRLKHFEARYESRAGTISGVFNPYIIPGYNCIQIDSSEKRLHKFAQVVLVSHSFTLQGSTTNISYNYGRTAQENYEGAIQEGIDTILASEQSAQLPLFDRFYSMFPRYPINTLANTLQVDDAAAEYYQRTFYQNADNRRYAFRFDDYFVTTTQRRFTANGTAVRLPTDSMPNDLTAGYQVTLNLKDENLEALTDVDKALQKIARPICTLNQYISFINGGRSVDFSNTNLLDQSVYGLRVPIVIRNYQASADVNDTSLEHYISPTTNVDAASVFDTRRDWASRIKSYRKKVYNKEIQSGF